MPIDLLRKPGALFRRIRQEVGERVTLSIGEVDSIAANHRRSPYTLAPMQIRLVAEEAFATGASYLATLAAPLWMKPGPALM